MTDRVGKICKQLSIGLCNEQLANGPDVSGQLV